MQAVWDGDTGTVTVTATVNGTAVNLAGTTARHVIARNRQTQVSTELAITSTDLTAGKVFVTAPPAGSYDVIIRATDASGVIVTYPSADADPPRLEVRADIDA